MMTTTDEILITKLDAPACAVRLTRRHATEGRLLRICAWCVDPALNALLCELAEASHTICGDCQGREREVVEEGRVKDCVSRGERRAA